MMWDVSHVTIAGVASAATALLTVMLVKGLPWFSTWLKYTTEERKANASLEAKGYGLTIARLDDRVKTLEQEIVRMRDEVNTERQAHHQCRIEQERLRAEIEILKRDLDAMRSST